MGCGRMQDRRRGRERVRAGVGGRREQGSLGCGGRVRGRRGAGFGVHNQGGAQPRRARTALLFYRSNSYSYSVSDIFLRQVAARMDRKKNF